MSRIEIEARFFLFTFLGALVHSDQFCPETINQEQLVADLLTRYPLDKWPWVIGELRRVTCSGGLIELVEGGMFLL